MKAMITALFVALIFGYAHSGLLPAGTYLSGSNFDSAFTKMDRVGGSFAYSTSVNHGGYSPNLIQPSSSISFSSLGGYRVSPLFTNNYSNFPFLHNYLFTQPFAPSTSLVSHNPALNPIISQSPFGIFAQNPSIQTPTFPIAPTYPFAPINGQYPVAPQDPAISQNPIIVSENPMGGIAADAPAPVQGTAIDEDTIAVEAL